MDYNYDYTFNVPCNIMKDCRLFICMKYFLKLYKNQKGKKKKGFDFYFRLLLIIIIKIETKNKQTIDKKNPFYLNYYPVKLHRWLGFM